ncbi:MAG: hypothetical protein HF311_16870 [Ignavibacteria bacterium]|nr:hypothetical protein [Ignavibacteria bacterium]
MTGERKDAAVVLAAQESGAPVHGELGALHREVAQGETRSEVNPLMENSGVISLSEGWRGEIMHAILTGPDGKIKTYKVKDPSFNNWYGLALSVRNEGISNFPLCNKSFDLSYSGHDL